MKKYLVSAFAIFMAFGAHADPAPLNTGDNISLLTNDAGYITSADLNGYATTSYITSNYTTTSDLYTLLGTKANSADVYTKTTVNTLLNSKADASDLNDLVASLSTKANSADVYTKTAVEGLLNNKASKTDLDNLTIRVGNTETAISTLNGDENTAGSIKNIANGYADTAEQNAKDYTDDLANGAVKNNTDAIAALQGHMDTAESDIAQNTSDISDLSDRMDTAESDIAQNTSDISDLSDRMDTAESDIAQNTSDISDLSDRMDTAESDIAQNTSDISDLSDRMDTAESDIATNADNITDLDTRLTDAENAIGDYSNIDTSKNLTGSNVVADLESLDTVIGDYSNIDTSKNLTGSDVVADLESLDSAIGDRHDWTNANVGDELVADSTVSEAISQVNVNLNNVLTSDLKEVDSAKVDVQWNNNDLTLNTVLGNGEYTSTFNVATGNSVTTAISSLDTAIGSRQYTDTAVAYGQSIANTDLTAAVSQVASNIGGAVSATKGNIVATNTVNANLDALDTAIGNRQYTDAAVAYGQSIANTDLTAAVSQVASNIGGAIDSVQSRDTGAISATNTVNDNIKALDTAIGANVTNTYNNVATTNSVNQNIDAVNATIGDVSTLNAGTGSVGNALSNGNGTQPTTIVSALNNIDATLGQIHGLKFGNSDLKANSNLANGTTVEQHLVALDNAIGNRTYTSTNQVVAGSSVAVAVSALDKAIGANVNGTNGNIKSNKSVNENLDLIDAVVGNRNIVSLNKALNESVKDKDFARAFETTGNLIGDMAFDNTAYLVGQTDLSGAVRALDGNLHRVENEMQTIKREAHSGLAAVTAMSALVPNARDCGDTQISVGTGSYQDKFGIAAGAFHYVNDHVLLNAGASYGGHEQWAFRAGITFGL